MPFYHFRVDEHHFFVITHNDITHNGAHKIMYFAKGMYNHKLRSEQLH